MAIYHDLPDLLEALSAARPVPFCPPYWIVFFDTSLPGLKLDERVESRSQATVRRICPKKRLEFLKKLLISFFKMPKIARKLLQKG